MSLSDCVKCWETPCFCGWEYRKYPIKALEDKKKLLEKAIEFLKQNPKAKFRSSFGDSETKDDKAYVKFLRN